ncbi:MAG: nicotinate-nucleotide adenylyltransferase [Planctomycetes bacterium]|nr:nicotinate-nucleotide adenylyltransferase [Planctomycetota bacterium]
MKIGVLGGTFNPIHIGHLILAGETREAAGLDKVLFVPACCPPHKASEDMLSGGHRLRMASLAVADNPCFEASDIELRRDGVSYTFDTVAELRRRHRDDEFYFIIGADSLPELASWYKIAELVGLCRFLIGDRPGHDLRWEPLEKLLPEAKVDELRAGVTCTTIIGVSSSEIRSRARRGLTIRYLVPAKVEEYINEHGLYR